MSCISVLVEILLSLKDAQNAHPTRPEAKSKPQAYPLGYVEEFGEPRTQLGKGRVLARLGREGEIGAIFSIL